MYRCRNGRNPIDLLPTVPTIGTTDTIAMLMRFSWGGKMQYRLALDIGTASCGLVAVKLGPDGEPVDIIHHALHIFSEPLLPPKAGVGCRNWSPQRFDGCSECISRSDGGVSERFERWPRWASVQSVSLPRGFAGTALLIYRTSPFSTCSPCRGTRSGLACCMTDATCYV